MGNDQIDPTKTGRSEQLRGSAGVSAVWKLRPVFMADVGIVQADAKILRGVGALTIGRGTPTIVVSRRLFLDDNRVSREQAHVYLEGSRALVKDLESKNGTDVNGRSLRPGEPCELSDGDVLRCGDSFLVVRHEPASAPDTPITALIGVSQAACKMRSDIASYARADDAVLLLGETGTGKGAAAEALHALSGRPGSFVAVNCAAVPESLAEGMFFGVKRGAYTGAVEQAGYFGEAHNGTLLLDEIGDLPIDMQPKLLRAIEKKQVAPLGQGRLIDSDVRLIAATNRDLKAALSASSFRADLYHRVAGIIVHLPPLRERREDILILAAHLAKGDFRPSPALAAAMLSYAFPGNVREVGNLVGRVRAGGEGGVVASLSAQPYTPPAAPADVSSDQATQFAPWKHGDPAPTRDRIVALLKRYRGKLSLIESEIGYSRRQFSRWVAQYGLDVAAFKSPGDPAD